jgi:hypothetical protein
VIGKCEFFVKFDPKCSPAHILSNIKQNFSRKKSLNCNSYLHVYFSNKIAQSYPAWDVMTLRLIVEVQFVESQNVVKILNSYDTS